MAGRLKRNFVKVQSAEMGDQLITGLPWKLEGQAPRTYRSAPALGQDNDYVFQELLCLTPKEQKALEEQGVIY